MSSRDQLRCFNNVARGTCTNTRAIARQDVESRVLAAMKERFFAKPAFDVFCQAFTQEMNRLVMERRAGLSGAKAELNCVEARQKKLLAMLLDDVIPMEQGRAEMKVLEGRRLELVGQMETADEPPPLLHPNMAATLQQKVAFLAAALDGQSDNHVAAREALRDFLTAIVIPPGDALLEVRGNLGKMLTAAAGGNEALAAAVGSGGSGGVQPAVLAAVECRELSLSITE
jgi:hypothetical protein